MNPLQDFVYHKDDNGNLVGSGFHKKDLFSDLAVPAGLFVQRDYNHKDFLEEEDDPEDEDEGFSPEDNPVIDPGLYDRLVALVQVEAPVIVQTRKKRGAPFQKTRKARMG